VTASTEDARHGASREHPLRPEHVAGCLALSAAANWNQNEADWRLMLSLGHGWGISEHGRLVASTLVLPYGGFAWISMVLVLPEQRRKGYASRLLSTAIADLHARGLTPILDATPAGHAVYRQAGFHDSWTFKRFFHGGVKRQGVLRKETGSVPDFALDAEAFGAERTTLLRALQERLPQAALGGRNGFVLGRDGREANQIGPLVARDEGTALALLEQAVHAVGGPLYVDVVDHAPPLQHWLEARGFMFQRPFTRMVHGASRAPGDESLVYLVAGPELG
jgi:GNAT superfamily N-acetyltransferase